MNVLKSATSLFHPLEELRNPSLLVFAGLFCVVCLGLFVRLDNMRTWYETPEIFFVEGEPLLTSFDGYYFLAQARELLVGVSREDGTAHSTHFSLLSMITALVARVTPFSLNRVGAVLPALFGVLLALPLFGLGRFFGGSAMGLSSVLMGLLFPYYVSRSSVGWLDTDCLNVTFSLGITYFFLRFGTGSRADRYWFLIAGFILSVLFYFWWNTATGVVVIISLLPCVVALLFFYRPAKREGLIFYGVVGLVFLIIVFSQGVAFPLSALHSIKKLFVYFQSPEGVGFFPSPTLGVTELERRGMNYIISRSTDSLSVFIVSCLGLVLLFRQRPKESLFLSIPFVLALLSFVLANRFLIFLAPITALGIGYIFSLLWGLRQKYRSLKVLAPLLLAVLVWPVLSRDLSAKYWPNEPAELVRGMAWAAENTPEDAVIWAWWDHGYPLLYWAKRGVVADGGKHGGEISVYNGLPLAVANERLAANFMQFYGTHGLAGMQKVYQALNGDVVRGFAFIQNIMAAGPSGAEDLLVAANLSPVAELNNNDMWLRFFFPQESPPVYLFLDWRLSVVSYWWFWHGTWDIEKLRGTESTYDLIYDTHREKGMILGRRGGKKFSLDLATGSIQYNNKATRLKSFEVFGGEERQKIHYENEDELLFEMNAPDRFGAVMDATISESVFNRLYMRRTYNLDYFRPVKLNAPAYLIWEVRGEKY